MFNSKSLTVVALVAAVFGLTAIDARGEGCSDCASKKKTAKVSRVTGRGLASLAPSGGQMGQGEQMLYNVKSTSPRFMRLASGTSPVKIAGVCRDAYGLTYNSAEKGYAACLSSRPAAAGSVNEYFGAAQRQAGLGILVGN